MSVRPATRQRIEAAHRFSAFYRGYLANHLPMALVALDAHGRGRRRDRALRAHVRDRMLEPPRQSHEAFAGA